MSTRPMIRLRKWLNTTVSIYRSGQAIASKVVTGSETLLASGIAARFDVGSGTLRDSALGQTGDLVRKVFLDDVAPDVRQGDILIDAVASRWMVLDAFRFPASAHQELDVMLQRKT